MRKRVEERVKAYMARLREPGRLPPESLLQAALMACGVANLDPDDALIVVNHQWPSAIRRYLRDYDGNERLPFPGAGHLAAVIEPIVEGTTPDQNLQVWTMFLELVAQSISTPPPTPAAVVDIDLLTDEEPEPRVLTPVKNKSDEQVVAAAIAKLEQKRRDNAHKLAEAVRERAEAYKPTTLLQMEEEIIDKQPASELRDAVLAEKPNTFRRAIALKIYRDAYDAERIARQSKAANNKLKRYEDVEHKLKADIAAERRKLLPSADYNAAEIDVLQKELQELSDRRYRVYVTLSDMEDQHTPEGRALSEQLDALSKQFVELSRELHRLRDERNGYASPAKRLKDPIKVM